MQSIDSVLLLSHPLSMAKKAVRNGKKLYMQMCANAEEKHRQIIQMCSDENTVDPGKINAEIEKLLISSTQFAKKMAEFERKRSLNMSMVHSRISFIKKSPDHLAKKAKKRSLKEAHPAKKPKRKKAVKTAPTALPRPENLGAAHLSDERVSNHDAALLNAMACDFLARKGLLGPAEALAETAEVAGLFDSEPFRRLQSLVADLKSGRSDTALKWCDANRSRLSRLNCGIKLILLLWEFCKMVRAGQGKVLVESGVYSCAALDFAEKHIRNDAFVLKHAELFSSIAFGRLEDGENLAKRLKIVPKFRKAFCLANGLPRVSPLELVLRIGVAAIKCSSCDEKATRRETCPVCVLAERFGAAFRMDGARFANSILFCGLSGELLGENNPPMLTKFGSIYGLNAMAAQKNKERIYCPRFNKSFRLKDCRRVYIV